MYGGQPYGSVQYGSFADDSGGSIPGPSGGSAAKLLLMGIRALLLVLLPSLLA
jgi:hypothetical protein